jgi:thioester reductase-like protein
MVEHILQSDPSADVVAVVKEKFLPTAEASLKALPAAQRKRLSLVAGDAAAMDFGLSGAEYRGLLGTVTRLFHVAQVTYPGAERELAEKVNLGGARETIEFAKHAKKLESALVFSSAGVSGSRTGLVRETDLSCGQSFRTPVEASLARAEKLLSRYMPQLPITIVRPTQIVGDSRTGEVDRFDGPYLLILLIVSSPQELPVPLPTRGDAPMNLVPIDYVVQAAWKLVQDPRALGKTFHLTDPRPLSVRRVFELVATAGGKRLPGGFIPTGVSRAVLSAPGVSAIGKSPKALVDLLSTPVRYDTAGADALLGAEQLTCPPFEEYVDALVAYVKRRVQERKIREQPGIEDPDDAFLQ